MAASVFSALFVARASSSEQYSFRDQVLTVPDGFSVELVAESPLVDRPIIADFDEQGRLYVSDSSGSNDAPQKQLELKPHRVVRLTDTNGDGVFDETMVYADKMMFPAGAMWLDGSLFVGAPPTIWKLSDTDGDGVADRREEWMQGKTLTGCANDLHGPYVGPDGWIYWAKGAFAEQRHERPGREPFITRAAHIFRARPDGSGLEPVLTGGMDNPVAVVFTPEGERIITTTFLQEPRDGKRDGLIHDVYGGVYGKENDVNDDHPQTGELLPALTHLGAAASCGMIRYTSDALGADYRDNLFSCSFNLHKVFRHVLKAEGASYRTEDSDFLVSNNPDFHPTDVIEDADGSVLVLDTGGWYKLCCPTSQLAKPDRLGAIYRVRRKGATAPEDPRGLKINWPSLNASDLARYLADPRLAVRKRAMSALARQGAAAVPVLATRLDQGSSSEEKRNILWTLTRIDLPEARANVRGGLEQSDASVRHTALTSISLWRDGSDLDRVIQCLSDPDAGVRRVAAEALGRIGVKRAVPSLLNALSRVPPTDRMAEHSLIFALIEIDDPASLQAASTSTVSEVRHAALIALDQMRNGHLQPSAVTSLLTSKDETLRHTARWIVSRHKNWGSEMASYFRSTLKAESDAESLTSLKSQLSSSANDRVVQKLMADAVRDQNLPQTSRVVVLQAMADAGLAETPLEWQTAINDALSSREPALLEAGIMAARRVERAGDDNAVGKSLCVAGQNTALPVALRLRALAALKDPAPLDDASFVLAASRLEPAQPLGLRNDAASVLAVAQLNATQLSALADMVSKLGPLELNKVVPAFTHSIDAATADKLLNGLAQSKAVSGLRRELFKTLAASLPPAAQPRAQQVFELLHVDIAKQKQHIEDLVRELAGGDVRRGQLVFNNPKFACSTCHSIGYAGGHIGPDLTTVSKTRTERDLLEAIVYPSASFVRSFEPYTVTTKSGTVVNGLLKKDAPDEVVIASGADGTTRIPRADIAEMAPGTVSVMPQGLDGLMTKQEFSDLLAFLKATTWGAK